MLSVCVISDLWVYGWPPSANAETGRVNAAQVGPPHVRYLPLDEALSIEHATDAYFAQYSVSTDERRLRAGAEQLVTGGVPMSLLIFDIDCPKSSRVDGAAPDDWRLAEYAKLEPLFAAEPGVVGWQTRGGYRLLGLLDPPFVVDGEQAARDWSELYVRLGAYLHTKYGIIVDPKCRDWPRLQGCPRTPRARDYCEFMGAPLDAVGSWQLDDVDLASNGALSAVAKLSRSWEGATRSLVIAPPPRVSVTAAPVGDWKRIAAALVYAVSQVREGGGRHQLYLDLSGVLLDRGVSPSELPQMIRSLSIWAGVDTPRLVEDRVAAARTTVTRAADGMSHTRIGSLVANYPDIARALDEALPSRRTKSEEAAIRFLSSPRKRNAIDLQTGSDLEVAKLVLSRVEDDLVYDVDDFWACRGGLWQKYDRTKLALAVHDLDGVPFGLKGTYRANDGRVRGAIARAADVVASSGFFAEAPAGIAFSGGFLSIDSEGDVEFTALDPSHRQRAALNCVYADDAVAPRFARFLEEVFAPDADGREKAGLLQEFVGACLVGVAPKFKKCLMTWGKTNCGKSTFLDIVAGLFPTGTLSAIPPHKFSHGDKAEYYLARLAGARLNVVDEMPSTDVESSETFKAVVAGGRVQARQPRGEAFEVVPVAGHVFAANDLMGTTDHSDAYWGRFLLVHFGRSFSESEMEIGLAARILSDELPGVAAWAVAGARRLLARGHYAVPQSSLDARERWRRAADQVATFCEERVEKIVDGEKWTSGSTLYAAFKDWSYENGHKGMTAQKFAHRMESLGWIRRRTNMSEWRLRVSRSGARTYLKPVSDEETNGSPPAS